MNIEDYSRQLQVFKNMSCLDGNQDNMMLQLEEN